MKQLLVVLLILSSVICYGQPLQMGPSQQFISNAYVWQDLRVPLLSTNAAGSNPPGLAKILATGSSQGIFCYAFDRNIEEELYASAQFPHGLRKYLLSPHIHWAPSDNSVATVTWGIGVCYIQYWKCRKSFNSYLICYTGFRWSN